MIFEEGKPIMENKGADCEVIHPDIVAKVHPKMPSHAILNNLSDFFKVMGDPTRIRLLWALEESEMCVCDMAVLLDMTKSAVSHQLKALKNAKLVKYRRDGKHMYYTLDDDHVKRILEMGLDHISEI